jgi:hypothetical protein
MTPVQCLARIAALIPPPRFPWQRLLAWLSLRRRHFRARGDRGDPRAPRAAHRGAADGASAEPGVRGGVRREWLGPEPSARRRREGGRVPRGGRARGSGLAGVIFQSSAHAGGGRGRVRSCGIGLRCPSLPTAASNWPCSGESAPRSLSTKATLELSISLARFRATASGRGSRSTPRTSPRSPTSCAIRKDTSPRPHPTSRTRIPPPMPASTSNRSVISPPRSAIFLPLLSCRALERCSISLMPRK